MKISPALPLCLSLAACSIAPAGDPPPTPEPPPPPPAITAAPAEASTAPAAAGIQATPDPVPADVKLVIDRETEHRWEVGVARKGYLIALRQGSDSAAGNGEARLAHVMSTARGVPIVWEATDPVTLVTTRGLVEIDTEGEARLRMTEAPMPVAGDTRLRHACRAHEDGAGAFIAVCRVRGFAAAESVTRSSPREGVWIFPGADRTLIRAELGAQPDAADAVAVGYPDGLEGVVVRIEATRVAGEDQGTIVIQSASRKQPVGVFPMMERFPIKHPPRFEIDF